MRKYLHTAIAAASVIATAVLIAAPNGWVC